MVRLTVQPSTTTSIPSPTLGARLFGASPRSDSLPARRAAALSVDRMYDFVESRPAPPGLLVARKLLAEIGEPLAHHRIGERLAALSVAMTGLGVPFAAQSAWQTEL
jgi:hypothetical protein